MNIIVNLLYGFTMLFLFTPSHAPAMFKSSHPSSYMQKFEQKLEFWHNDEKIAEIPASVANKLSTVFNAQLHAPLKRNKFKINFSDEFNPEAVKLFTRMVNAPTTLANPLAISALLALQVKTPAELQKMLIHADCDLVIDLYDFLTTYDINEFVPLLAEYFACELSLTNDLYNHPILPFFENQQFRILIQAVCSLPAYSMILVQEPMVIEHTRGLYLATFSPDGKYVVTASRDGTAQIYDITKKQVIDTIAHTNSVRSARFSPDGKYVATASDDGTAQIYDITKKQVIGTIAHTNSVTSARFSPDGKYVVTVSNRTAQIYDIEKKQVIGTIKHTNSVRSARFSPDGKYVATASDDRTTQIYNIEKKQVIGTIQHTNVVASAQFSPDGMYVVTASWDKTAKIYDITAQKVIHTIPHNSWVTSATFSPDGKYVVTASYNGKAQIYDITTKQVIGSIAHTDRVRSAVFSPDGRYVVTASRDNTARITPLTLCGMPDIQVITIVTLIDLAKQIEAHEVVEPLVQTGWLYKEFKKLSDGEQQRLYSQFTHIKQLIDNAKDDVVREQYKK